MPECPKCNGVSEGSVCQYCRRPFDKPVEQNVNVTIHNYNAPIEQVIQTQGGNVQQTKVMAPPPPPPPPPPSGAPKLPDVSEPLSLHVEDKLPRRGFQALGIVSIALAMFYLVSGIIPSGIRSEMGATILVATAVFMLILGFMFLVLSRFPKGQKRFRGKKGMRKSLFVVICLVAACFLYTMIMGVDMLIQ